MPWLTHSGGLIWLLELLWKSEEILIVIPLEETLLRDRASLWSFSKVLLLQKPDDPSSLVTVWPWIISPLHPSSIETVAWGFSRLLRQPMLYQKTCSTTSVNKNHTTMLLSGKNYAFNYYRNNKFNANRIGSGIKQISLLQRKFLCIYAWIFPWR